MSDNATYYTACVFKRWGAEDNLNWGHLFLYYTVIRDLLQPISWPWLLSICITTALSRILLCPTEFFCSWNQSFLECPYPIQCLCSSLFSHQALDYISWNLQFIVAPPGGWDPPHTYWRIHRAFPDAAHPLNYSTSPLLFSPSSCSRNSVMYPQT